MKWMAMGRTVAGSRVVKLPVQVDRAKQGEQLRPSASRARWCTTALAR